MSDVDIRALERRAAAYPSEESLTALERAKAKAPCFDGHKGPWEPIPGEWLSLWWQAEPTHEVCESCGGGKRPIVRIRFSGPLLSLPDRFSHVIDISTS